MVAVAVAVLAALSSCAVGCSGSSNSSELKLWRMEDLPMAERLTAVFKEMQSLRCEEQQQQQRRQQGRAVTQMDQGEAEEDAGTRVLAYDSRGDDQNDPGLSEAWRRRRRGDPCFHYTILDQTWRATNVSSKFKMCDRNVKWKGWYRLFYKGKSLQMPERCVPVNRCGTHAPLWLAGRHPRRRDGIVTRQVCGHWKKNCCAFKSNPIQVKKCRGNYYVYKFSVPTACYLAYCADTNTLVCGRCSRNQSCVSRDKINWRCKRKRRQPSRKIHFFASYPGQLSGKVNRIKFSKVLVNMGRGYSRSTGVFRAPVGGIYQFFFSTQTANTGQKTDLWLVVNNYWVAVSHTHVSGRSSVGGLSTYMTYLRRRARVYVTHNCGRSWANDATTTITFGGSLLVQMK